MTTPWAFPSIISQEAEVEQHVSWSDNYIVVTTTDLGYLSTTKELLHISNSGINDVKMKTYFLYLTGFSFLSLPTVIAGVEVELNMKRGGRITDEIVQLRYNGAFLGENRADYKLDNVKIYGDSTDTWGLPNLTPEILNDTSFGVGLRFQSHPNWPHKEHPMIGYVRIRVW